MPSQKFSQKLWNQYYSARKKIGLPSQLLRDAMKHSRKKNGGLALDLGCGTGADAIHLLKRGYEVHAFDAQSSAVRKLRKAAPKKFRNKLVTRVIRFENVRRRHLPQISILNASFSIFFCRRSSFFQLWRNLSSKIEPGGIFCGQFIGPRDSWAKEWGYTAVSRSELRKLFGGFDLIKFSESEDDSGTLTGNPKHWHIFTIIAQKI